MAKEDLLISVRMDTTQARAELRRLLDEIKRADSAAKTDPQKSITALRSGIESRRGLASQDLRSKAEELIGTPDQIKSARREIRELTRELAPLERKLVTLGKEGPVQAAVRQKILPTRGEVRQFLRAAGDLAATGNLKDFEFEGPKGTLRGPAAVNAILRPLIPKFTDSLKAQGLLQDTPAQKASRQERLQKEREVNNALSQRLDLQRKLAREVSGGGPGSVSTLQKMVDNEQKIRDLTGRFTNVARFTRQLGQAQLGATGSQPITLPIIQGLNRKLETLQESEEGRIRGGLAPTRNNILSQMGNIQRQQRILGPFAPPAQLDELRTKMERLVNVQKRYGAEWDTATKTFTHHALRIAEGLILYSAFTKVLQGLSAAFDFTGQVDRDTTRLGQVLVGLSATETDEFLSGLGDVAIETATDFRELISVTDLVAGAFRSLRTDSTGVIDTQGLLGDVEGMSEIVGEFTNVLGGANTEQTANQLVSLFRITKEGLADITDLAGLEPLERFRAFLDSVVTLGHRSAFEINQLSDGLLEAGLNANVAGFDLRLLTAVMDQMIFATGQSGREIGTLLRTSLAKLSDPKVLDGFQAIVKGAFSVRDATGQLREADDILVDLFSAVQTGALTAEQSREALGELIPPLNPGAIGFNNALIDSIGAALLELARDSGLSSNALEKLSLIIANTLPGRFQAFQSRIQKLMLGLTDTLEESAESLIGFGNTFLGILEALGPDTIAVVAQFLAFTGGTALLLAVLGKLKAVLVSMSVAFGEFAGAALFSSRATKQLTLDMALTSATSTGLTASLRGLTTATGLIGITARAGAAGVAILRGAFTALAATLAIAMPILLAFAALEVGAAASGDADKITRLRETGLFTEEQAQALVHAGAIENFVTQQSSLGPLPFSRSDALPRANFTAEQFRSLGVNVPNFPTEEVRSGDQRRRGGGPGNNQGLTPIQARNLTEYTKALLDLEEQGLLTTETQNALNVAFHDQEGSIKNVRLEADDLFAAAINGSDGQDAFASSLAEVYRMLGLNIDGSERLTASQLMLQASTAITESLTDEQSSALAGLVERLRSGEISLEEFAQGQSQVQEATELTGRLIAGAADQLRALPQFASAADSTMEGLASTIFQLMINAGDMLPVIRPLIEDIIRLAAAGAGAATSMQEWYQNNLKLGSTFQAIREGTASQFNAAVAAARAAVASGKAIAANINAAVASVVGILNSGTSGAFGTGPSAGSAAAAPKGQRSIIDVGELSTAQVQQAIQMAIALQNSIPGAAKDAANEFISLLRDAKLVRNLKGVDNRLLQEAIDQLTEEMKKANELAKAETAITKNLQVNAGPFAALVSQPFLFGAGGDIANGVGFDPTAPGNFVINIDIGSLSQLNPAQAAALIEEAVRNAIRDGLRLQGVA